MFAPNKNNETLHVGETILNFNQGSLTETPGHWSHDYAFVVCADKTLWVDEVSGLKLWCEQKFGERGDQWQGSGSIWAFSREDQLHDFLAMWQNKVAPSNIPKIK
ncbi:hypothetical protein OIU34_21630 [Pararhizobium sp. BT-229]|uniref:hypothetical protein n=1 Tax=Pararhizobium sp. BT-229 TaxID=2986923 RepID=UPI0021F748CE|nr:hypothetical protein [Pararhizobium sp. BT-229]MCV9964495.1 hypothetical protein [Pararhizobium sp. BT-229]